MGTKMKTTDRKARAEALAKALGPEWTSRCDPYNPVGVIVSDGVWVVYELGCNFQASTLERTPFDPILGRGETPLGALEDARNQALKSYRDKTESLRLRLLKLGVEV